jgi:hypothetical protein
VDVAIGGFVEAAFSADTGTWDEAAMRTLAARSVPSALAGSASWLVMGDAHALWSRWFLEALADPRRYVESDLKYPHLFKQVRDSVSQLSSGMPVDEQRALSRTLADLLWREVERLAAAERVRADRELRLLLFDLYARCWICGGAFPDWARARFLREDSDLEPVGLPFVDFLRPRGVNAIDLRVEVEHVMPHALGGAEDLSNLRLACGWCNRAKGKRTVLYDAEGAPRAFNHPLLGLLSVPQPFWVVRLLAMRQRCEFPGGCQARSDSDELTVVPRNIGGAPNPANLMVICASHDPLRDVRLLAARYFRV